MCCPWAGIQFKSSVWAQSFLSISLISARHLQRDQRRGLASNPHSPTHHHVLGVIVEPECSPAFQSRTAGLSFQQHQRDLWWLGVGPGLRFPMSLTSLVIYMPVKPLQPNVSFPAVMFDTDCKLRVSNNTTTIELDHAKYTFSPGARIKCCHYASHHVHIICIWADFHVRTWRGTVMPFDC